MSACHPATRSPDGGVATAQPAAQATTHASPAIRPATLAVRFTARNPDSMWLRTFALLLVAACARPAATPPAPDARPTAAPGPVIVRLVPDHGRAGRAYPIRVVIEGRAFADTGNVVAFGPITMRGLASSDGGTRITFFAPKEGPSPGEVPPPPLAPGAYDVTVTTPAGTSPPVRFTLTES